MKSNALALRLACWWLLTSLLGIKTALAGIHNAPIVLTAKTIGRVQYHPLAMYRLFRSEADGSATIIPFQIDERDRFGDFILDEGPSPNQKFTNGIFDFNDELSF